MHDMNYKKYMLYSDIHVHYDKYKVNFASRVKQ